MKNSKFIGKRLVQARKMAGMSLQALADALDNKVTKQALSKYELGSMKPQVSILIELGNVLSVKPEFFLRENLLEFGEVSFRKQKSLAKVKQDAILERAKDYVSRYLEIESILGVAKEFVNPLSKETISTYQEVENASKVLRKLWELGSGPIPNVTAMLEMVGVRVMLIEETDKIDGFATFSSSGIPVVVINKANRSVERVRFTIVHELAHILLVFSPEVSRNENLVEKLCHYFASCFLLPTNALLGRMNGKRRDYIAIKELITIKELYGISIRAIVYRLKQIKVISENYYTRWIVYMSKTYGSKKEPGLYRGDESAQYFGTLIDRALVEGEISISKAAELSGSSIQDIRKGVVDVK